MSSRRAPQGRGWNKLIPVATAMLSLSLGVGIASGQSGGGGVGVPSPPKLTDVECLQMCAGIRKAGEGSVVKLSGSNLDNVRWVAFKTADGRKRVEPSSVAAKRIRATVPEEVGVTTGNVRVIDDLGNAAATPTKLQIVNTTALSDGGNFRLTEAQAAPRKTYYFSKKKRRPKVNYVFKGEGQTDVRIEVVKAGSGKTVRSWVQRGREPLTNYSARWNGRTNGGKTAPNGRFRFRIGAIGNGAAETTADSRFRHYSHIFPVRGKPRGWGDGFGAGRGHQGQDIFVSCGTKLVAARGGKVTYNRWHGAAGWFVVIDGKGTGRDYAYMHLKRRSPLKRGQVVRTGEPIGKVGETGNASGCHLHFEIWTAPGWYRGGHPMRSVTKQMRRWAGWS